MNNIVKPKISVVMPFYNAANFLDESISSILKQTFKDFELILINDASTDHSDKIVSNYLSDPRIIYVKNETNQGIVKNLNKGINIAKAEIIARMDGDDISLPKRFSKQYEFLKNHPDISVVGSFVKIIDSESKIIDQRTKPTNPAEISKKIISYSPLVHPSTMFRKRDVLEVGLYREEYIYVEDIDLWYRLIFSGKEISNIDDFLLHYRYHQGSTAHNAKANAVRAYKLRRQTIKDFDLKIGLKNYILIYSQFLVGVLFSGRTRQAIEGIYKKLFYHGK